MLVLRQVYQRLKTLNLSLDYHHIISDALQATIHAAYRGMKIARAKNSVF